MRISCGLTIGICYLKLLFHLWFRSVRIVGNITLSKRVGWNYFSQSYEDYSKLEKDDVVDYNHRLRILGAFNDEFRRIQNPPVPTEQGLHIFKDNMLHLMEYFSDPLDRAEMYREIGLFEECFKQLEMVDDEGDESKRGYKETIFEFAKQGSVSPFGWGNRD